MSYFKRSLEAALPRFVKFPVVAILGPRQSGKSTLAKHAFIHHKFVNLEDLELRELAKLDPKGFLRSYENEHGIILDEFQNCPEILSTIQVLADEKKRPGYFVLTGSHNFLMNQAISQSLAGRVGILTLLPLSLEEMKANKILNEDCPEDFIFKGSYPRLFESDFSPSEIYPSYIQTYVERDVRQLMNIKNLASFNLFLKLCAARVGQLVNFSDLATHCGVSVPTIHQWLNILEASYIVFLLRPYWENFNKRVTKTPKIYFYDTGLASSLLGISSSKDALHSNYYGYLFENAIVADFLKQFFNQGLTAPLSFWRDKNGTIEVDCLVEHNGKLSPIEIKSGESFQRRYFESIRSWKMFSGRQSETAYVIYGGKQSLAIHENEKIVSWHDAGTLMHSIRE